MTNCLDEESSREHLLVAAGARSINSSLTVFSEGSNLSQQARDHVQVSPSLKTNRFARKTSERSSIWY